MYSIKISFTRRRDYRMYTCTRPFVVLQRTMVRTHSAKPKGLKGSICLLYAAVKGSLWICRPIYNTEVAGCHKSAQPIVSEHFDFEIMICGIHCFINFFFTRIDVIPRTPFDTFVLQCFSFSFMLSCELPSRFPSQCKWKRPDCSTIGSLLSTDLFGGLIVRHL